MITAWVEQFFGVGFGDTLLAILCIGLFFGVMTLLTKWWDA